MRKRERKIFWGTSNLSGFEIGLCKVSSLKTTYLAEAKTKDYKSDVPLRNKISNEKVKNIRRILLFVLFLGILLINHFLFYSSLDVNIYRNFYWMYFLLISLFVARIFDRASGMNHVTRQWHACEHKAVHLLGKRAKLNLKSLKRARRFHRHCGAVKQTSFSLFKRSIGVLTITYLVCFIVKGSDLSSLLIALGTLGILYIIVLGLVVYVFTTSRPTEEQLEETLRVAKEFKFKLEEQGEGR